MHKFKVYFWKYVPKELFKDLRKESKDRLKDYMNVYIFGTLEEMYAKVDKIEKTKLGKDYSGRCYPYSKVWTYSDGTLGKLSPMCGNIYLCDEDFTFRTISHEVGHAIIGYFGRKVPKYKDIFVETDKTYELIHNPDSIYEELFCYMLGNIVNDIVIEYDDVYLKEKEQK